jgi:hypothetical protein
MEDRRRPRILTITYRSAHHPRRVIKTYAKVPYSGIYALTETLSRALSINEILWFRVERTPVPDIKHIRSQLVRWPQALGESSRTSDVTWDE